MEYNRVTDSLEILGSTYYQEPEHNELYGELKREFVLGESKFLADENLAALVRTDYDFINACEPLSKTRY